MGKPRKQEEPVGHDMDEDDAGMAEPHNLHSNPLDDDDYIDDWISHVDDFGSNDDVNNW